MTSAPAIPLDPLEVFRLNDAHRRDDAGDADLWLLDQVAGQIGAATGLALPFPVVGARSVRKPPRGALWSQAAYAEEFARMFPEAADVLAKASALPGPLRLCVAGGAAACPFSGAASDVDFFIALVDPRADIPPEDQCWEYLERVRRVIKETLGSVAAPFSPTSHRTIGYGDSEVEFRLSPGVLSVWGYPRGGERLDRLKFQVILRVYRSFGAAVHAFDVGASCVYYDGAATYLTTMGAFAHAAGVNLVNPAYRSTTYERRLAKYAARGYGLGLVHICPEAFAAAREAGSLALPHIRVTFGPEAAEIEVGDGPASDYCPFLDGWSGGNEFTQGWRDKWLNLEQLVSGKNMFGFRLGEEGAPRVSLDWDPPILSDFLSAETLDSCFATVVPVTPRGVPSFNPLALVRYLGMTPGEVLALQERVLTAALKGRPLTDRDIRWHCDPFCHRVLLRYAAVATAPIEWWIRADPGRQYTASVEPRMEDPAEWYGAAVAARPPAPPVSSSLPAAVPPPPAAPAEEAPPKADDAETVCAICLQTIFRGAANTITLACKHTYHAASRGECGGLFEWIVVQGKKSCPQCRADYGAVALPSPSSRADPYAYRSEAYAFRAPDRSRVRPLLCD